MAGKRNHHIPRWLQAGFVVAEDRPYEKQHVWMYKKVGPPELISTRDYGVSKHYYRLGDSKTNLNPDHEMTLHESLFYEKLAKQYRETKGPVNGEEACDFAGHLYLRSDALRKYINRVGALIAKDLVSLVKDNPEILLIAGSKTGKALEQSNARVYLPPLTASLQEFLESLWTPLAQKSLIAGQLSSLKTWHPLSGRLALLEGFSFEIVEVSDESLVLGDGLTLFRSKEQIAYALPLTEKPDELFVPLSPSKALHGWKSERIAIPAWTSLIVEASQSFFVSNDNAKSHLVTLLGSREPAIDKDWILEEAETILKELTKNPGLPALTEDVSGPLGVELEKLLKR